MPLLYYWRWDNYHRDLDLGAGYHLNQDNPKMHAVDFGRHRERLILDRHLEPPYASQS